MKQQIGEIIMDIKTEARVKMGGLDEFIRLCVDRIENEAIELSRLEAEVDLQKACITETERKRAVAQFEYDALSEKLEREK